MKTLELNQMEKIEGGSDCPSFDRCVRGSTGLGLLVFGLWGSIYGYISGNLNCTCNINNA
ncbi:MAG: hypothetical protein COZ76_12120 [Flavobacteriales bacterium CG_4_8_14_3_um_filter_35_10]|nr:MAG: hypothetical protein COZ76_12120 [Flavobacteriales bacterium CG_4_8_14_3_um_filter_35_10]